MTDDRAYDTPSVTRVLRAAGLLPTFDGIPSGVLERKAKIGTAVHFAVEVASSGGDLPELHPEVESRFAGYRKFCAETGWVSLCVEYRMEHPVLRYNGKPDAVGRFPGAVGLTVVDWKTGVPDATHPHQLAAYGELYNANHPVLSGYEQVSDYMVVELRKDGEYRIHRMLPDVVLRAFRQFRAAVDVYWARYEIGRLPKEVMHDAKQKGEGRVDGAATN